ncbi:hypothetical protein GNF80_10790 [Clostridium perfringens]|nr:hypothetical protein [Clostridium perfringens]
MYNESKDFLEIYISKNTIFIGAKVMKNIVIIHKVNVGIRPHPSGMDGGINFFKKSLSQKLKDKLNEILTEINYFLKKGRYKNE